MKVTNLPAYQRLKEKFIQSSYSMGIVDDLPIYVVDDIHELLPHKIEKANFKDITYFFEIRSFIICYTFAVFLPQHCLYFLPLPQGHGSFG